MLNSVVNLIFYWLTLILFLTCDFFPQGLREMLNIASRSGSLQPRTNAVDAGTQTGQDSPKSEEDASHEVQEEESASIDTHKSSVSW